MEINFSVVLLNVDDERIKQPIFKDVQKKDKDGNPEYHLPDPDNPDEDLVPAMITVLSGKEDMTLGIVSRSALLTDIEGQKLNGRLKQELRELAYEIKQSEKKGEALDLEPEQITKIRDRIGKVHSIALTGAARPLLDVKKSDKSKKNTP